MEGWVRMLCGVLVLVALLTVSHTAYDLAIQRSHPLDHARIADVRSKVQRLKNAAAPGGKQRADGLGMPAARYRLSLSLMVPSNADAAVGWSVEEAFELYLQPLLVANMPLGSLARFEMDSQVLYFSQLAQGQKNSVSTEKLQGFLSANDWNANSVTAPDSDIRETSLHLMVYLAPSMDFKVIDSRTGAQINSFMVPRWGGVVVLPFKSDAKRWVSTAELETPFEEFGRQLTRFLEADDDKNRSNAKEKRLVYFLSSATDTLSSLSELVQSASEMIVPRRVSLMVAQALVNVEGVLQECSTLSLCCQSNNKSATAMERARSALEASELVFFDPSLLPQLYFPPEHWFSVFMPLLLPTILSTFGGLFTVIKSKAYKKR